MFLTHADDVADHARWAKELPGLKRVIHITEADPALALTPKSGFGLENCEIKLEVSCSPSPIPPSYSRPQAPPPPSFPLFTCPCMQGDGPWEPFEGDLGVSTRVIFQPGHTVGQCVLHFQPSPEGHAPPTVCVLPTFSKAGDGQRAVEG